MSIRYVRVPFVVAELRTLSKCTVHSMASRRLRYEWKTFQRGDHSKLGIEAGPENENDIFTWQAIIDGPKDTPYEDGRFHLKITYPTEYPFKPPKVKFITPVFHPNISSRGTVCIDILAKAWSPAMTTSKILLSIISLLTAPNPDDPMDAHAANLLTNDPDKYIETVRDWTARFANK